MPNHASGFPTARILIILGKFPYASQPYPILRPSTISYSATPNYIPILRPRTLAYSAALFPILFLISQPYLPTLSPKPYPQTISPNLRRPTSSPNLRSRTTGTNLASQPHRSTPSPNLVAEPHRRTLSPDLGPRTLAATLCGLLCGRGPWTPTAAPLCAGASMDALSIHQLRHRSVRALPWTRSLFPN